VFETWRCFDSFELCLVLIALALVLNGMSEKLGCLEWWWVGVFIAPTTKPTVGEVVCRWAHQTIRCATEHCPVHQPRHPTVRVLTVSTIGALTSCRTGQSGAAPDRSCSLPGAPLTPALTSVCTVHALFTLLQTTAALIVVAPLGAPDSPMNYSGAALQKPEGGKFEGVRPWAPDSPVCHTRVLERELGLHLFPN
jgi:hypothetical protein